MKVNEGSGGGGVFMENRGGGGRHGGVATCPMFIDYVSAAQVNRSQDS